MAKLVKFLLFIVPASAGKSTLIQGISGCPKKGYQGFINDSFRHRKVYIICSSPQESGLSVKEYKSALKEAVSDDECNAILVSIQPTNPYRRLSLERCVDLARKVAQCDFYAFVITHPHEGEPFPQEVVKNTTERLDNIGITKITKIDSRRLLAENVTVCLAALL